MYFILKGCLIGNMITIHRTKVIVIYLSANQHADDFNLYELRNQSDDYL